MRAAGLKIWETKRCERCYAVLRAEDGVITVHPAPGYSGQPVECTRNQYDRNVCPVCSRPMLMVVY
jgi:hypothetical protein